MFWLIGKAKLHPTKTPYHVQSPRASIPEWIQPGPIGGDSFDRHSQRHHRHRRWRSVVQIVRPRKQPDPQTPQHAAATQQYQRSHVESGQTTCRKQSASDHQRRRTRKGKTSQQIRKEHDDIQLVAYVGRHRFRGRNTIRTHSTHLLVYGTTQTSYGSWRPFRRPTRSFFTRQLVFTSLPFFKFKKKTYIHFLLYSLDKLWWVTNKTSLFLNLYSENYSQTNVIKNL